MSPSPVSKMGHPQRTSSQDSTSDGIRKRVCKACDRCRLKKSKCDGSHPCSRCKADNAICVFGERKKSHDKVYPKGYVEMLEQQQSQLVLGLQEMYKRLRSGQQWDGQTLSETNGHPLTHDILAALNLLGTKQDGTNDAEVFEEDLQKLQSRLLAEGSGYAHRRGSMSSESEQSQHGHLRSASHGTPLLAKSHVFSDSFHFSPSSSPHPQSPAVGQRPAFSQPQSSQVQQHSPLTNDPQLYQAEWAYPQGHAGESFLQSRFAMHGPKVEPDLSIPGGMAELDRSWNPTSTPYDVQATNMNTYPAQQLMNTFGAFSRHHDASMDLDNMDLDLNQFIQVMT